jgi:hypothetical protein
MANAGRWAAAIPGPAYAIDDQTAINVADGTVEVVSEGRRKPFAPAPEHDLWGRTPRSIDVNCEAAGIAVCGDEIEVQRRGQVPEQSETAAECRRLDHQAILIDQT